MTTSLGHTVNIGTRVVRIPTGWSISQRGPLTLCGRHELKQRVALCDGGQQRPEDIRVKGQRTAFRGKLFSGHLEESVIPASFMERLLFRRKPHYRFEWVLQHDDFCLVAIYLCELDDARPRIKELVKELLDAMEIVA